MLRFRQYIIEKWFSGVKASEGMVDLYHNPNRKEMKQSTSSFNDTRAIIKGNDIITWNAEKEMHHRVRHFSGISGGIDALIDHGSKSIQLYGEPKETMEKFREYQSTPHFDQHFKDYKIEV